MFCILIILLRVIPIVTAALSYCSSQNTGSLKDTSVFMSNGLCLDQCSGYAFAIVQGENCYCSNDSPSTTNSLTQCDSPCPGYPSDYCGGQEYFGYINQQASSSTIEETSTNTNSDTQTTYSTQIASSQSHYGTTIQDASDDNTSSTSTATSTSTRPSTSTNISTSTSTSTSISSISTSTSSTSATTSSNIILSTEEASSISTANDIVSTIESTAPSTLQSTSQSTETTNSITSSSTSINSSSSTPDSTSASAPITSSISSYASTNSRVQPTYVLTSMVYSVSTIHQDQTQTYVTSIGTTVTLKLEQTTAAGVDISTETDGSNKSSLSSKNQFWGNKGKVAGVFTAVGIISLIIIILLIFIILRCCQKDFEDDEESVIPADSGVITSPELIEKPSSLIGVKTHDWNTKNGRRPSYIQSKLSFIHHSEDDLSSSEDTILNDRSRKSSYGWLFGAAKSEKKNHNRHTRTSSLNSFTEYDHPVIDYNGDISFVDPKVVLNKARFPEDDEAVLSLSDFPDYSRRVFKVTNPDANESCHSSLREQSNNF